MSFDPASLSLYPEDPGVYLMKDNEGKVLYIGKAKNLRARLKQYFAKTKDTREMVPYLTAQVTSIDTIVALTEKDALILENTLIKRHKPKYNVLLKDDKTFISLMLTKHKWPMLRIVRHKGNLKEDGTYFGPYTSALAARHIFDLITRLFPLRQCSDNELANRIRPCLLFDIKKCIAPCVKYCTEEEYAKHVDAIRRLLKGQTQELTQELHKQMHLASENLEFEKAGELLTLIQHLEHVTEKQHVEYLDAKECDVLGLYTEQNHVMISLLLFRDSKMIGSEHFSFHFIASDPDTIISSFLLQNYKEATHVPSLILSPIQLSDQGLLEELLSESAGKKITITTPQKGKKQDLIEMANRNAKALFIKEVDAHSLREKQLLELAEILQLSRFPSKIECFDTSNISGSDPVASLVSFINGEKEKKLSRLFKIKTKADDYSALKEVLHRHFSKAKEKNEFPDLLIVDGGKGQLQIALEILKELSIASIDVIALTKEDALHTKGLTQEKIILPLRKDPILLDPKSPLLFLLQKIRDEAHRQAIQYHRKKRQKRIISSSLDDIPGIGPTKKRNLLKAFGSVKAIQNATPDELKKVPGIQAKDIETITAFFKN